MPMQCQRAPEKTALAHPGDQPSTHSHVWAGEQRHLAVIFPLPFFPFPQMLSKMIVYIDSGLQCLRQLVTSHVLPTGMLQ